MVLRRCESETWKFGFIKRVDKGGITAVKDLKGNISSLSPSAERIEMAAFQILHIGNSTISVLK